MIFEEMREASIEVWEQYRFDSEDHYRQKIDTVKYLPNTEDNFMYIFAMFDINNQQKLISLLSLETKQALRDRLTEGGVEYQLYPQLLVEMKE